MAARRLVGFMIDLAVVAVLLAACGGAAEPTPKEAPAAAPEAASETASQVAEVGSTVVVEVEKVVEQTVVVVEEVVGAVEEPTAMPAQPAPATPVLSFAVVHDTFTELFSDDGSRVATVDTTGPASVQFSNDKAIVVDTQLARVFNPNGSQAGQSMPMSPGSTVAFGQERVAISHDTYVAVYGANGQPLINIDTPVPVESGQAGGLLVLSGAGWTGVVHPDGRMLLNVQTQGQADLRAVDGRLVLIDDATVRFFDAAGRQMGSTVDRVEPTSVFVVRNRVVLAHPGWTEIFTPDGAPVARITTAGLAAATPVDAYLCLRDDGGIKLLDLPSHCLAGCW